MKEPTIKDRLAKIEQVLYNEIRHEMKWHRWLLLVIIGSVIGGAIAQLFS